MDRLTGHDEHSNIADEDRYHLARRYYNLLIHRIDAFKAKIPQGKRLAIKVGGHANDLFLLEEIHYADPTLIAICGSTLDGLPIEVIQDVSHLNISLILVDNSC
ncbi:MAG: hypothetical protein MI976_08785 [Pseudomonadales bacterium]|nr:hypothetical protein [Pseudomonadales bacterium]